LWLGHNLHATKLAPARDFRWHEDRFCSAALALHFERIRRQLRHLFRANLQVLLERLLLNLRGAFRYRFLVAAVRAREKTVSWLVNKIGSARRTGKMEDFTRCHGSSRRYDRRKPRPLNQPLRCLR